MIVKYYRLISQLTIMQPAPGPPVQAPNPQPIQPMQPMQPMAAYQPQPKFLDKYGTYSFSKWLMIAIVIIVIGAMFAQVTDLVGAPNPADYEDATKYAEDQFSHEKLGTSLGALSSMLQSVGMGLIAYALLREANQGDAHHTAVRVTAVITGVLLVGNIAAANLSIL
ncbi:MAG TPA: hypothetical protein D7H99_02660 [Candidatus Poseidoniales archaeon]|nr:hypothetical protein [Euryarchaeota archaeon]DAC28320.1 MAG TPA: hypothetical protein D7H99_02660 [Candidatus Poseidoniales archaeon]|tara:strand:- start:3610 stop:4110 length:501 start_codon:yes stop_codon:yes gene_type:complete